MTRAEKISAGQRRRWSLRVRGVGLAQMKAATPAGQCPFCDDALRHNTTGRKAHTCGAPECKTAWFRCWRRDHSRMLRSVRGGVASVKAALDSAQGETP